MNLFQLPLEVLFHYYRQVESGPGTLSALGWKNEESQRKRFEVLAGVGDFDGRSVLDLGCGYGDFRGFLTDRCRAVKYVGVERMGDFTEEARRRYGDLPDTHFVHADFTAVDLPEVDYVIACGLLAYRHPEPDFQLRAIERMYRVARRAVAFTMLDSTFPDHPVLIGHDRDEVVRACSGLCPHTEVIEGYLDGDFTVYMRRP